MGEPSYLIHPSGLKYKPTYGTGSKSALTCFGRVLNSPTFTTPDGLDAQARELPEVIVRELPGADNMDLGRFRAIANSRTNEVYSVLTDHYRPVQDYSVIQPFVQMAKERNLSTAGRIVSQGGKTRAYVTLFDPNHVVRLLEEAEDDIAIMVRLINSHKGDRGWGFMFAGIRMWCCNFNAWGHVLGKMHVRHATTSEKIQDTYYKAIEAALDKSEYLRDKAHDLNQMFLRWDEMADLAWGANASPTVAIDLEREFTNLVPESAGRQPSVYDLWNALTAAATWSGTGNPETLERLSNGAERLWYQKHDALIERGRARKEAYMESLKPKEVAPLVSN
jgi:hypothetical protein